MKNFLPVLRNSASSIRHNSIALECSDLGTKICFVTLAKNAVLSFALGSVTGNHNVSCFDRSDTFSNGLDNGSCLMTKNTKTQQVTYISTYLSIGTIGHTCPKGRGEGGMTPPLSPRSLHPLPPQEGDQNWEYF